MTRREFVIKNYGSDVVDDEVFGGIQGCPSHYKKLVEVDKSITSDAHYGCCIEKTHALSNDVCTKCWDREIPGTEKTRPHGFRLEKKGEALTPEKIVKDAGLSIKEAIHRAVCDCDTCDHQNLCRFECKFRGMTKEMYQHCIVEMARYNLGNLGIQMRPLHCKRYEESSKIDALNTAIFHLKAQHLTDEMVRKIFGEEPKETK